MNEGNRYGNRTVPGERIPNYLAQSIIVTLLCCLPLGIPAIIYASQVDSKALAGDIQGAWECSRKAKMWCWLSFVIAIFGMVLYVLFTLLAAATGHLE